MFKTAPERILITHVVDEGHGRASARLSVTGIRTGRVDALRAGGEWSLHPHHSVTDLMLIDQVAGGRECLGDMLDAAVAERTR